MLYKKIYIKQNFKKKYLILFLISNIYLFFSTLYFILIYINFLIIFFKIKLNNTSNF